jgi:hypothetical protein
MLPDSMHLSHETGSRDRIGLPPGAFFHQAYLHFRPYSFSNSDKRFSLSPNPLWFKEMYPRGVIGILHRDR